MDYLDQLKNLKHSWEKREGLIFTILIVIGIFFTGVKGIIKEMWSPNNLFLNFLIPILLILIIWIFWMFSTKRWGIIGYRDIDVGLIIKIDDPKYGSKAKKLVNEVISNLNNTYEEINFELYPINYVRSKKELEIFVKKKKNILDSVILIEIVSGNLIEDSVSVEKMKVSNMTFAGKFDVKADFSILQSSLNISKDLSIREMHKDWSYIEGNSFEDKLKFIDNLRDTLLFYSGFYLIYLQKFKVALKILKLLYEGSEGRLEYLENGKYRISKKDIAKARLNGILINLYFLVSTRAYHLENDKQAHYTHLKECLDLFKNHPESYIQYISLARSSYELGKLEEAIIYNDKADSIRKGSTAVTINRGFFALVSNDSAGTLEHYKNLAHSYRHKELFNFSDILEFLSREKYKYPESKLLFDFAIGLLNIVYLDRGLGIKTLKKFQGQSISVSRYDDFQNLVNQLIIKGAIKSVYHKKQKKKQKKRKKSA